jgi:hypothetical protein
MRTREQRQQEYFSEWQQIIAQLPDEHCGQEVLQDLAVVDAFVLAHSELTFEEFFSRLRRLDAWQTLSSRGL